MNKEGIISLDFLMAIAVLMFVVMFSITTLATMITPYSVEDNRQHLDSTLSVLISHSSTNSSIGLSEPNSDIISGNEVDEYFVKHTGRLNWYELSDISILRDMGFSKYDYYIQVLPVDDSKFDKDYAESRAIETVNGAVVDSVVRHKMLLYTETGVFYGEDLYGKVNPTKPAIIFDKNDTVDFEDDIRLTFREFIPKSVNKGIKDFRVGYELDNVSEEVKPNTHIHPDVIINGNQVEYLNQIDINITDNVEVVLNCTVLDEKLLQWRDGFALQFNFDGIEIQQGETYYNSSIREINEPYKIVVWSWFNV